MKNHWLNIRQIELRKYVRERLLSLYYTIELDDASIDMIVSYIKAKLADIGKPYTNECFKEGLFRKAHMLLIHAKINCNARDKPNFYKYKLAKEEYQNWESKL